MTDNKTQSTDESEKQKQPTNDTTVMFTESEKEEFSLAFKYKKWLLRFQMMSETLNSFVKTNNSLCEQFLNEKTIYDRRCVLEIHQKSMESHIKCFSSLLEDESEVNFNVNVSDSGDDNTRKVDNEEKLTKPDLKPSKKIKKKEHVSKHKKVNGSKWTLKKLVYSK